MSRNKGKKIEVSTELVYVNVRANEYRWTLRALIGVGKIKKQAKRSAL